ncbi:MAG: DEAD/DEAH box helicase [Gemmataceae bacterium]
MTTATLVEPASGFHSLNLTSPLLEALDRAAYRQPTPIQAALIPPACEGRDVIGQAQTGTGKTAAFLLPFFNGLSPDEETGPQALVLTPTRELAVQVKEEARKLAPSPETGVVAIYGGTRVKTQANDVRRGINIAVGTPGRVLDFISRGILLLNKLRYVVLDEADRMLDIGFRPDIERILRRCPQGRQTLLLSATLPDDVLRLALRYMDNPLNINLSPTQLAVEKIRQTYITVDEYKKFDLLRLVLDREEPRQSIIFCQTKRKSDRLFRELKEVRRGVSVMHGDLPQPLRERIMQAFRDRKVKHLIATDVVGRGIDVLGISHIINYDLPDDVENYVHRIGRTGRMGADGVAISFVTPEQGKHLTSIELAINNLIAADNIEGFEAFTPRAKEEKTEPKVSVPVYGRQKKKYSWRV